MTIAELSVKPPASAWWRRLQRERALIALFDAGSRKTFALFSARLYAFGVFVSYAIAIALTRGATRPASIHGFVQAALVTLSWAVGALAALGSAQALAARSERDALSALAMQRGFTGLALLRARTLAAAVRIARLVGIPALLLVAVGVVRGASPAWALAVAPAVVVYACALGLSLALLAHFSAEVAPRHPRSFLIALVLGPLLLSRAFPTVPSIPQLFSGLLALLLGPGAGLS